MPGGMVTTITTGILEIWIDLTYLKQFFLPNNNTKK
jgi:hypothetical protein